MFCNQPLSAYTARSTQAREPLSVDAFNGRSRAWLELDTNANWVTGKMVPRKSKLPPNVLGGGREESATRPALIKAVISLERTGQQPDSARWFETFRKARGVAQGKGRTYFDTSASECSLYSPYLYFPGVCGIFRFLGLR